MRWANESLTPRDAFRCVRVCVCSLRSRVGTLSIWIAGVARCTLHAAGHLSPPKQEAKSARSADEAAREGANFPWKLQVAVAVVAAKTIISLHKEKFLINVYNYKRILFSFIFFFYDATICRFFIWELSVSPVNARLAALCDYND